MKWIALNTVLSDLVSTMPTNWSEDDALEWAFKAMRKLKLPVQYENKVEVLDVENYTAYLPDDYELIELMAYKLDSTTTEDLEQIRQDLGHTNDLYYTGFLENYYYQSQYKPLRLAKSPFAITAHCDTCVNLVTTSEHEYRVYPNNTIKTTFEAGTICLAYRRYAKDSAGNYLVPDDEDYIDALRSYILMRIWEYRMNVKEQGAAQLFQFYFRRWGFLRRAVNGKLRGLRTLDEWENLRQQDNRLIRKERDYYTAFSNRPEEDLSI